MKTLTNPIIMHINFFEQGQSIEHTIRRAVELGYDGVEFRRCRPKVEETMEEYLNEIKRCSEQYGLRYVLFGSPGVNVMTQDASVCLKEIENYKRFLDAADSRFTLSVLNIFTGSLNAPNIPWKEHHKHGSGYAEDWHWESATRACQEIAEYAPHVKFAFETHHGYLHDRPEAVMKLCKQINRANFGVNLDYGNMVYFASPYRKPLEEAIDFCGEKIFYTHLKNSIAVYDTRVPTSLSQGEINHRAYMEKLKQMNYSGFIGIEAPRSGDREYFAYEDLEYLKTLL